MDKPQRHVPLQFLGLACAVGVSSIYYNQPLLVEIGQTFGVASGHAGYVAVATQVGYACGLLTFVPMGDLMERRSLMMRLYAAVSVALLCAALSTSLVWLVIASAFVGLFASVTHVVLPLAPDLAKEEERGKAVGIVMTGLLLGVLLARTFAGWVSRIHLGHAAGWRTVFFVAAIVNASFVPLLAWSMQKLPQKQKLTYGDALLSLKTLWMEMPVLRESAFVGALQFAAFSCFWTTLALLLHTHYDLGAGVAGSFGLVGAAGAVIAPTAGKMADRHGTRYVIARGLVVYTVSYLWLWGQDRLKIPVGWHLGLMVIGVIVMDMGAQMSQIANQVRVLGLNPNARGRLNTVYMTVYFVGAAIGSAAATFAWVHWEWDGVCALALVFTGLAAIVHTRGQKNVGRGATLSVSEERVLEV